MLAKVLCVGLTGILAIICLVCHSSEAREMKYGCVLPREPLFGSFTHDNRRKSISYYCDEGFILIKMRSNNKRKCRKGKWTNTHGECLRDPKEMKLCPLLASPRNGQVIAQGRKVGDMAEFMCDSGYLLEGSNQMRCITGRIWTGTIPICRSYRTAADWARNLEDKFIDRYASSTTDSASGAQSRLSVGKRGLDIVFLVDVSSSIGKTSLDSAKKFMKMIVKIFGVSKHADGGKNGTRFAIVTFSNNANIVMDLNDENVRSVAGVKQAIDSITNTGGGTSFRPALNKVSRIYKFQIDKNEGRKLSANRAIFIITDAEETTTKKADRVGSRRTATYLKTEKHFEIFAIGVGVEIDKFTLKEIASAPFLEHVFLLDQFENLERVGEIINEKNIDYGACGISGNVEITRGSHEAKKGAWPWLGWVTVYDDKQPRMCGGTLLCKRWFMTAAHCVTERANEDNYTTNVLDHNKMEVHLGDFKLFKPDDKEIMVKVNGIHIHSNYTGELLYHGVRANDIALLDLGKDTLNLAKFIRPICFPTTANPWVIPDNESEDNVDDEDAAGSEDGDNDGQADVNENKEGDGQADVNENKEGDGQEGNDAISNDESDEDDDDDDGFGRKKRNANDTNVLTSSQIVFLTRQSAQTNIDAGYTAGWGLSPLKPTSVLWPANRQDLPWEELRQDRRQIQSSKNCRKRYEGLDTDMFFCVGNTFDESIWCRGDIGGPYMDELESRRFAVFGLALKSSNCKEKYKFSIFLNLLNPAVGDWVTGVLDGCNRAIKLEGMN